MDDTFTDKWTNAKLGDKFYESWLEIADYVNEYNPDYLSRTSSISVALGAIAVDLTTVDSKLTVDRILLLERSDLSERKRVEFINSPAGQDYNDLSKIRQSWSTDTPIVFFTGDKLVLVDAATAAMTWEMTYTWTQTMNQFTTSFTTVAAVPFPHKYATILAHDMTVKALQSENASPSRIQGWENKKNLGLKRMIESSNKRQVQTPRYVKYMG